MGGGLLEWLGVGVAPLHKLAECSPLCSVFTLSIFKKPEGMHGSSTEAPCSQQKLRAPMGSSRGSFQPRPKRPVPWAVDVMIPENSRGKPFHEHNGNQVGVTKHWQF